MVLFELIDYSVLKLIWWGLLGILLIGFAVTDGFDMGAGTLMPFVGRTDIERRVAINSIAPTWEGNQVWFVLGEGPSSPPGRRSMRSASPASISPCS